MNKKDEQNHELIECEDGSLSLRNIRTGQAMHSSIGPANEAMLLYIRQSGLKELLRDTTAYEPLVVYDVGLGIAANSALAFQAREEIAGPARPLHVVSFENDLSGIRLALEKSRDFPFLQGREKYLQTLLKKGEWTSEDKSATWTLLTGDFFETLQSALRAELIYYDFYSPNTCPELWGMNAFTTLREKTHPRGSRLFTYTGSTAVRLALLLSGFAVGYGASTSQKAQTTVAATRADLLERPLGREWIEKLKRSQVQVPFGMDDTPSNRKIVSSALEILPQFT